MSYKDLSDYDKGYLDCSTGNDRFMELITLKRPIEQKILRFAAEQGLCSYCRAIILRLAEHE